MNEISNFCNGECTSLSEPSEDLQFNPNDPPYKIDNQGNNNALNVKTLDMDAIHYGPLMEYDVHNLYGNYSHTVLIDVYIILYCRTDGGYSYS